MSEDLKAVAGRLTKAQYTALWNLDDSDTWQRAPHDGWRRAGQACSSLVKAGLAEKASEDCGIFYRLNGKGRSVRAYIRSLASLPPEGGIV